MKKVKGRNNNEYDKNYIYIRDASGNVMANYMLEYGKMTLEDHVIYSSSRLGIVKTGLDYDLTKGYSDSEFTRKLGLKRYELSNHLGNVLVTLTDKTYNLDTDTDGNYDTRKTTIASANDYYPFGMLMPGRQFNSEKYRFGFQGQEKDDEIHGSTGSVISYKYRIHDPRIGRFLSIDPLVKEYPWNSPYAFSENRVIDAVELEGAESLVLNKNGTVSSILPPHAYIPVGTQTLNASVLRGETITQVQIENANSLNTKDAIISGITMGVMFDIGFTGGTLTRRAAINLIAQGSITFGVNSFTGGDNSFSGIFNSLDFSDAGFAMLPGSWLSNVVAPSLFDFTGNDGLEVFYFNKRHDEVAIDLFGNGLIHLGTNKLNSSLSQRISSLVKDLDFYRSSAEFWDIAHTLKNTVMPKSAIWRKTNALNSKGNFISNEINYLENLKESLEKISNITFDFSTNSITIPSKKKVTNKEMKHKVEDGIWTISE